MSEPAAPTKEGYTFAGWYKEGWAIPFGFSYETILSDTTLVAKWEKKETIMRTVTFNSDGGTLIDPVEVEHGFRVSEPAAPTKEGYTFVGWYKEGWSIPFGFSYETILSDTTLVAKWEKNVAPVAKEYKVTFESNGGSAVAAQTVEESKVAVAPKAPTKAGYTFKGWYADTDLTTAYDFSIPVTKDITLYAKWEKTISPVVKEYKVTFESNGGSAVAAQTVEESTLAVAPKAPTKADYTFQGWYADTDLTTAYDFSTPVTKDIILYAKWEKVNNGSQINNNQSGKTNNKPSTPLGKTLPKTGEVKSYLPTIALTLSMMLVTLIWMKKRALKDSI